MITNQIPNILETKNNELSEPIMVLDNKKYCHCIWKNNGLFCYSRFNGVFWEYLNDCKFISSIPNGTIVPKQGMDIDINGMPYILWANPTIQNQNFGNLCNLYLTYWNGTQWINIEKNILLEILWGASLLIINDNIYIGTLIYKNNKYIFRMILYKDNIFTMLKEQEISPIYEEPKLLLKKVNDYIYCFWNCKDTTNFWLEHIIYDINNNTFWNTSTRKVIASNDNIPIAGFDFVALPST